MAAISADANRPWDTAQYATTGTTNWEEITVPTWVREVTVQNPGASDAYVSKAETGARGATDDQILVPAGQSFTFELGGGREQPLATATKKFHVFVGSSSYNLYFYLKG